LIETVLAGDGHDVVTAADGLKPLQRYLDDSFDRVCTDLEMPNLKGVEFTRPYVQAGPATFPFCWCPAPAALKTSGTRRRRGSAAFLETPFTISTLRGHVRALVSLVG
jgi:CheY-like chemotaxis protein